MDRHRRGVLSARLRRSGGIALAVAGLACALGARAEPYVALRAGAKCTACHVNPTGGGKRTEFGALYGALTMSASRLAAAPSGAKDDAVPLPWTGRLNEHLAIGGDLRADLDAARVPDQPSSLAFATRSAQLYLEVSPVPDRLTLYVDERVAPGAALNRETYALLWSREHGAYLKAGRFFLPYGLRLEDDTAFIRQASGINFTSSDDGIEGGVELGPWSAQLAVSNGTAGAAEIDRKKQVSLLASYVQPLWRAGASVNANDSIAGDRRMRNLFAGLKTGPVVWLAELDVIADYPPGGARRTQRASFVEGDVEIAQGHNLKLTYELLDPDLDAGGDERRRLSLVWELWAFEHTQFRFGLRGNRGPAQIDAQNAKEMFLQWHAYF
jgi:hypothetical protein